MKPIVVSIVVVLALLTTGYLFFMQPGAPRTPTHLSGTNLYANGTYGISFSYPESFLISEKEVAPGHYAITLIREEDAVPVVNGEGPTAITIDIYEDAGDSLSAWLSDPRSNASLGDGTVASTTVAGVPAVSYGWSGLYEGESIVFLHEERIFSLSVTYHSPADAIRTVYHELIESLVLR